MSFSTYVELQTTHFQRQLNILLKQHSNIPNSLFAPISYSLLNGGKYIRPLLVYACGESLGIQISKLNSAAIAIELIHAYSLIHDDLPAMDNATLRRGKLSCHKKFGEASAILAGDTLQTLAFESLVTAPFLSEHQKISLIKILAHASGCHGMIAGQSLDINAEGKLITLAELKQMHQLKTGKLISAAIMMPVSLAKNVDATNFEELGNLLGLAYQIQDDILDVESETAILGKEKGIDEKNFKNTYTTLLGLNSAKNYLLEVQQNIQNIFFNNNLQDSRLSQLVDYIFNRTH